MLGQLQVLIKNINKIAQFPPATIRNTIDRSFSYDQDFVVQNGVLMVCLSVPTRHNRHNVLVISLHNFSDNNLFMTGAEALLLLVQLRT